MYLEQLVGMELDQNASFQASVIWLVFEFFELEDQGVYPLEATNSVLKQSEGGASRFAKYSQSK